MGVGRTKDASCAAAARAKCSEPVRSRQRVGDKARNASGLRARMRARGKPVRAAEPAQSS